MSLWASVIASFLTLESAQTFAVSKDKIVWKFDDVQRNHPLRSTSLAHHFGCSNLMVGYMPVSFGHRAHSIDVFVIHSGGRATITKFFTEIDTTAFEFCKPVINSRFASLHRQEQLEAERGSTELSDYT
ncbi:hypothetical protein EVAR_80161_1 [Eumeta japonica]|uniref:Uncharacterized protein n=1 Tax=Eumeta variegata TaxID=151549 RepID=A0A4C1Y8L6_EUMVA|nr:hypothetical protein EVAR_80161_1 [Eumeta japonica]